MDDEPALRTLLHRAFTNAGFEVQTASDGTEALRLYEENRPDLVLTDIQMPVMDGVQLVQNIRAMDEKARCCVMSGYSFTDLDKLSALAVFEKPFNVVELVSTVSDLLEQAEPAEQLST